MKVVIVENEELPRKAYGRLVESLGYDLETHGSVEAAIGSLRTVQEPFIVLLDHDLGQGQPDGYALCAWLRREHPLGLVLPIVYLTGRLAPEGYLDNQRERPFEGPSVYLAKATANQHLPELLARFSERLGDVERTLDKQAARRALSVLSRGVDEPDDDAP